MSPTRKGARFRRKRFRRLRSAMFADGFGREVGAFFVTYLFENRRLRIASANYRFLSESACPTDADRVDLSKQTFTDTRQNAQALESDIVTF